MRFENIPGVFEDISNRPPLEIGDDGEVELFTSPGNLVFPAGGAVVANNGGVRFGVSPDTNLAPDNEPIPSVAAFGGGQAVLVYWDDLDDKDGDVFVSQDTGDLIVQWDNRRHGRIRIPSTRYADTRRLGMGYLFDDSSHADGGHARSWRPPIGPKGRTTMPRWVAIHIADTDLPSTRRSCCCIAFIP